MVRPSTTVKRDEHRVQVSRAVMVALIQQEDELVTRWDEAAGMTGRSQC